MLNADEKITKYYSKERNSCTLKHFKFNKMGPYFGMCAKKAVL